MRWIMLAMVSLLIFSACTAQNSLSASETTSTAPAEEVQDNVEPTEKVESDSTPSPTGEILGEDEQPPRGAEDQFTTDFSKHSVPYSEILSGGPPKDGIPSIDSPLVSSGFRHL